jgi:hypothetical protein
LTRREVLERGDESQPDRLTGLEARLGPGRAVLDPLEQHVGVGLEPDRLGAAGGLGRLEHGGHLLRSARAGAQRIQAPVGRDAVQPRAQRSSPLVAIEPAPGGQQRFLQQVLGVLQRADDPVAVHLQLVPVRVGQLPKRLLVARPSTRERLLRHRRITLGPPEIEPITPL